MLSKIWRTTIPANLTCINLSELFGERTHVVSPGGIVEREQFYRTMNSLKTGGEKEEEVKLVTFSEKMDQLNKKKEKQEEFFRPIREHIGEADIQGMGFDARKYESYFYVVSYHNAEFFCVSYEVKHISTYLYTQVYCYKGLIINKWNDYS